MELSAIMSSLYEYLEDNSDLAVSSYMLFHKTAGTKLRARRISFLSFCLGRRFPLTGTLIRVNSNLFDFWYKAIRKVLAIRATLPCVSLCFAVVRLFNFRFLVYVITSAMWMVNLTIIASLASRRRCSINFR